MNNIKEKLNRFMKEKIFNILKYIIIVLVIAVCLFVLAPILILIGAHKLGVQWFIIWSILFIGILKIILLSLKKNKYFKTLKYLAYGFFGFIFLVSSIAIYIDELEDRRDYEVQRNVADYCWSFGKCRHTYFEGNMSDEDLKLKVDEEIYGKSEAEKVRKMIYEKKYDKINRELKELEKKESLTQDEISRKEFLIKYIKYDKKILKILDELY